MTWWSDQIRTIVNSWTLIKLKVALIRALLITFLSDRCTERSVLTKSLLSDWFKEGHTCTWVKPILHWLSRLPLQTTTGRVDWSYQTDAKARLELEVGGGTRIITLYTLHVYSTCTVYAYCGREQTLRCGCLSGTLAAEAQAADVAGRCWPFPPSRPSPWPSPHPITNTARSLSPTHRVPWSVGRSQGRTTQLGCLKKSGTQPFGAVLCIAVISGWGETPQKLLQNTRFRSVFLRVN